MTSISAKPGAPHLPTAEATSKRFAVRPSVLIIDVVMSLLIRSGGIAIIIAVLGIFIFILSQILPLFRGAEVTAAGSFDAPPGDWSALLLDEWSERPTLVSSSGEICFLDAKNPQTAEEIATATLDVATRTGAEITALRVRPASQIVAMGTADGRLVLVDIDYVATFDGDLRTIEPSTRVAEPLQIAAPDARIVDIDFGDAPGDKVAVVIAERGGRREVHAVTLRQRVTLAGAGKLTIEAPTEITSQLVGEPLRVLASSKGDSFLVVARGGAIDYFTRSVGSTEAGAAAPFELRQRFTPFEDQSPEGREIALAEYVFGDVSVVLANTSGENRIFSLFLPSGGSTRLWGRTKNFESLPSAPSIYATSTRNKSFLVVAERFASLRYATTELVRWEESLPFTPLLATISGKNNRLLFLGDDRRLHEYILDDPHPESSWKAFFGKVWYEGADEPRYEWQSTGGTDDFEPKLSMVPLLIGSLKGTFYALIFALPIALTAALYTSQFAHWKVRRIVKPLMEVMASLPSVVLGFLAALWLAPLLETRVPSVLLMIVTVPTTAMLLGALWVKLPVRVRNRAGLFGELAILSVGLAVALLAAWFGGPPLEQLVFVTDDPSTGERIADFRAWWPAFTGADFQQRNSLVVGFMMGFAVIPIIFTIAEDSLSNVPQTLRSGSLALGATRWQTAIRVVLPTASAGIFSALMVGLGRAVGETMIVLMATGNTPIMDFNIFSGMRTLSANIAVELPEAPQEQTLYRALFLGAMLLFLLTFTVNTLAEVLRQNLRKRYRTV